LKKPLLMTPGPTPIPERVVRAMGDCQIHHRSENFKDIVLACRDGLKKIFETEGDVLTLVGSGTAAMDATVSNFLRKGDRALVVRGGKFGERWGKICEAYGLDYDAIDVTWGEGVNPEIVREHLKQKQYAALMFQASETSTGAAHPTEALAKLAREEQPEMLVIVDGITAVGCMPVRTDAWGLDVVVSGSQKAFMLPPGLAFLTASERAWKRAESSDLPKFYLNLQLEKKKQAGNQTSWTSATSLMIGLVDALEMMNEEGIEQIQKRHAILSNACREAALALNLGLLAMEHPSRALTAVTTPDSLPAGDVIKGLREKFGIRVAGGQEHLKGRIFRIGHLGWVDGGDILKTVGALEEVLADSGHSFDRGAGLKAAAKVLTQLGN